MQKYCKCILYKFDNYVLWKLFDIDIDLNTLQTVEVCVKNCGRRFHGEVGKFRFLNEMIKVVSPKVKFQNIQWNKMIYL